MAGLAAVMALLATNAASPAASDARARCLPKRGNLVAASRQVVVYVRGGHYVACRLATGRRMRLAPTRKRVGSLKYAMQGLTLAGRYVLFVESKSSASSQGPYWPDRLHLRDVVRGRTVALGGIGCPSEVAGSAAVISAFGVTRSGAAAWTCIVWAGSGYRVEVHRFDSRGHEVLAATDGDDPDPIRADSLVVGDGRYKVSPAAVYWSTLRTAQVADLK